MRSTASTCQLVYQTADGETVVTIERAERRVGGTGIEFEVVSISRGSRRVSNTRTRPIIAIDAESPQRTVVQVDEPATDEVKYS